MTKDELIESNDEVGALAKKIYYLIEEHSVNKNEVSRLMLHGNIITLIASIHCIKLACMSTKAADLFAKDLYSECKENIKVAQGRAKEFYEEKT